MFENSLIALEKRPRSGQRWLSFPVAVAVHLAAFGAIAFVGTWTVGDVAEANLMESFIIPVQLPESPRAQVAKPQAPPSAEPLRQAAPAPPQVTQPSNVLPEVIPNAADLPTAPLSDANPPAKDRPACPDCNGTDPNADPQVKTSGGGDFGSGAPIVLRAGMKPPAVVSRVDPRYTETARKVGLQGVVIVEAVIDEHGRVESVKVLRGLPLGLEEAAVSAVRQWKFEPARYLDGRAVKVYYNLTINFRVMR